MKKKLNKKGKLAILIIVLLTTIMLLLIVINVLKKTQKESSLKAPEELSSIQELLKYYGCSDIRINNGAEEAFEKDIYVKFGEDLWKEEIANEGYFSSIVLHLSQLLEYNSYRLIDTSRELVIAVIGDKENKKNSAVYINGEINYFQKETAKRQATKKYEETTTTQMSINSKEIQNLIYNNFQANTVNFGSLESRFEDYDIYFDEGIEAKSLGGKIYNIIFTEKYKGNIVNNLKVNSTKEEIIKNLGTPTFENTMVCGYKGNKIYVFFSENAVSVYRIEDDYKEEEFLRLWQEFCQNKNAKKFITNLTDIWTDYDRYMYDSGFVALQYTLKGIKIEFNTNGENGLILYNNYNGNLGDNLTLKNLNQDNLPEYIYLHTDEDLVFLEETKRVSEQMARKEDDYYAMLDNPSLTGENLDVNYKFSIVESKEFNIIYSYTNADGIYDIKFISKNRTFPNSELIKHKQIYSYGWLNDEQFVYSVKGKGIYYYNAKTRNLRTLIEGNENYQIKSIENGQLFYDETSIKLR